MTDPTMLDFEKLCTWKAERRYPDKHLKQLGIELIRLDIAEYRIHQAARAADALSDIARNTRQA